MTANHCSEFYRIILYMLALKQKSSLPFIDYFDLPLGISHINAMSAEWFTGDV
jgi:hypothetical protein